MTTSFADHLEARFEKEGYVRLGRLLSDDELSALCRRSDDLMLGNVVIDGIVFQLDPESRRYGNLPGGTAGPSQPSLGYRRIDELHLDPLFLAYMQHPSSATSPAAASARTSPCSARCS